MIKVGTALTLLLKRHNNALAKQLNCDLSNQLPCVSIEPSHLKTFSNVIKWRNEKKLPPTYLQVLAFDECLKLMSSPTFPFRALGLVHISNEIALLGNIDITKSIMMEVSVQNLQTHERGYCFDFITQATQEEQLVYRATATNLAMTRASKRSKSGKHEQPIKTGMIESWQLGEDIGRQYAHVSGDYNPIHLTAWTAKLFGFKRALAHGMYCIARGLSAYDEHIDWQFCQIKNNFYSPVLLPTEVHLNELQAASDNIAFVLSSGDKTHLKAKITKNRATNEYQK